MADNNDKGNFVAYINQQKQPDDKKPTFNGRIASPGSTSERRVPLWTHVYTDPQTGEQKIVLNGHTDIASYKDDPLAQMASIANAANSGTILQGSLEITRGQVVLFENKSKGEPTKTGKPRPDYYGYYNSGGPEIAQIGAWATKDKHGNVMLSGSTSHKPIDQTQDQVAASKELDTMLDNGTVTKGTKVKSKSKSEDAGMSR